MKAMTATKLVEIVQKDYGLKLRLNGNGDPCLVGDRAKVTPALLESLKGHKAELIALLKSQEPDRATPKADDPDADPLIQYRTTTGDNPFRFLSNTAGIPLEADAWRVDGKGDWLPLEQHPLRKGQ